MSSLELKQKSFSCLRFEEFGSPSKLNLCELPKPILGSDEVLVQVEAAGVNPSDLKNVQGVMKNTTLPRIPGRDFAGIVIEGPDSLLGKTVWGTGGDVGFTRDGSHSRLLVIPQEAVTPIPNNLSLEEAGSVGVAYVTAWLCVVDAAKVQAGETLLVIGATGAVGSAATQIAKWKGAQVINVIRRQSDWEFVKGNGADEIINVQDTELSSAIASLTDHRGVNVIVDTVGGEWVEKCLQLLAPQGRLTEISAPANERRISFDLIDFYRREARLIGVDSRVHGVVACAKILQQLTAGFEGSFLKPFMNLETYPLSEGVKAYEAVLNRTNSKKVVLKPSP